MQLPIEEYFKYHPPTTPERIALHDRVNRESLEIFNELTWLDPLAKSFDEIADMGLNLAHEVCQNSVCLKWAVSSLTAAIDAVKTLESQKESVEAALMHIQQFRMFLNQGITIDELKRDQRQAKLSNDLVAAEAFVTTHIPVSLTPDQFQQATEGHLYSARAISVMAKIDEIGGGT